jgi:hypothetical protein
MQLANVSDHYPILITLKYKKPIDKNQKPAHTQKTKIKWDTADKDKYIELVNEGIQSSDLTLEMIRDICYDVNFLDAAYLLSVTLLEQYIIN